MFLLSSFGDVARYFIYLFIYLYIFAELYVKGQVNMMAIESKLAEIAFKTKMECNYARNPFTNQNLEPSTSEDVLQHMSADERSFSDGADGSACSLRQLPHGCGTLKTATGEFVYSGGWCIGKRKRLCLVTWFTFILEIK